jgi:hypothetical protein
MLRAPARWTTGLLAETIARCMILDAIQRGDLSNLKNPGAAFGGLVPSAPAAARRF